MWINFQRFGDIARHSMKEKMRSVQLITKPKEPLEKDIEKTFQSLVRVRYVSTLVIPGETHERAAYAGYCCSWRA